MDLREIFLFLLRELEVKVSEFDVKFVKVCK